MANTANVTAGKPKIGGAISVGPTTATLPTSATATLTGFTILGYVNEDGLTQTITRETDNVKAWGGDVILTVQTEFTEEFKFTLVEILDPNVKKVVFGDSNVSGTLAEGITVNVTSEELAEHAYVIDMVQHGATARIVIPNGKVSEIGDIVYADGEPVGYEITVTALPDANGKCSYEYTVRAS